MALLALPLALVGAVMVGGVAFVFSDPGVSATRRTLGGIVLVLGTVALWVGCVSVVGDVQGHLLSATRDHTLATSVLNPDPALRFLAGWRPAVGSLGLWLGAPGLLCLGLMLRQGNSKRERALLVLCWLTSAPLAILVLLAAFLSGEPLTA